MPLSSIYTKNITIPQTAIDENGHVNNVTYVQWMQDIAVDVVGQPEENGGFRLACQGLGG